MTIEIQQKGEIVFLSFSTERMMMTTTLTLLEARNLRDALTDMRLIPREMYKSVIKEAGDPEADAAPLPADYELIALADSQRRNEKSDNSVRKAILGREKIFPGYKERADP
jgi:hypothetical protein